MDIIKSKGIAGIKLSQEVNKESYEREIKRLKQELEQLSGILSHAQELLMETETKIKDLRNEHKNKSDDLVRFKSEEQSLALLIQSNKEKIKEQEQKFSSDNVRLSGEVKNLENTLAKERDILERFEQENDSKLGIIREKENLIEKLEKACDLGNKTLKGFEQEVESKKKELEEAKKTISTARLIEIGLEKREVSLSKKEDICEVRRRSLERMYKRKLGINISKKFYFKQWEL